MEDGCHDNDTVDHHGCASHRADGHSKGSFRRRCRGIEQRFGTLHGLHLRLQPVSGRHDVLPVGNDVPFAGDDVLKFHLPADDVALVIDGDHSLVVGEHHRIGAFPLQFKLLLRGELYLGSGKVAVVLERTVSGHGLPSDGEPVQLPVLGIDMLVRVDDPGIHVVEIALVGTGGVGGSLSGLVHEVPVHGELHARCRMLRGSGLELVAETEHALSVLDDLGRREVCRPETVKVKEAALVDTFPLGAVAEVGEDSSADIVHVESGTFPFLQLDPAFLFHGIHLLHQTECDGVPELAADHVDAVEAQLGHFKEFPEGKPVHLAVSLSVELRSAAAYHALDEIPAFDAVEELDAVTRFVRLVFLEVPVLVPALHPGRGRDGGIVNGYIVRLVRVPAVGGAHDIHNPLFLAAILLEYESSDKGDESFQREGCQPIFGTNKRIRPFYEFPQFVKET